MFNQLRHAVESFTPRQSLDSSEEVSMNNRTSASPSQLAELALLNLRKSIATHRSNGSISRASPLSSTRPKLNLEERLRASLSNHDLPSTHTHEESTASPITPVTPMPEVQAPLSPESIPLPDSPPLEPVQSSQPVPDANPIDSQSANDAITSPPTQSHGSSQLDNASTGPTHTPTPNLQVITTDLTPESVPTQAESNSVTVSSTVLPKEIHGDVEQLQERLKQVELRFSEVSGSFKRLQAEKLAADSVLQELTPVHSVSDAQSLRRYLQSLITGAHAGDEVQTLRMELNKQTGHVDELQSTHKAELASHAEHIGQLKNQLSETETLLRASQQISDEAAGSSEHDKREIGRLEKEVERLRVVAKEEEEKRTKAISLLKTVRQKLVKTEKEKEDALKEVAALKEKDKSDKENFQAERGRLQHSLEAASVDAERIISSMKTQHARDLTEAREQHEEKMAALRARFESETSTLKNSHAEEISLKSARISSLEKSLRDLASDKDNLFDQLQLRQAEVESSRSHLESVESQNVELQYQLRECKEQIALLHEDISESRRQSALQSRDPAVVASDVAQMVAATEAKYEAKIAAMKREITTIERERNESEAEWNRKLQQKYKELDEASKASASAAKAYQEHDETVKSLQSQIAALGTNTQALQQQLLAVRLENGRLDEQLNSTTSHERQLKGKIGELEKQMEEYTTRENQLRLSNKALKEELRKVQSSAAILERQRVSGAGYWSPRNSESTPDVRPTTGNAVGESTPAAQQKEPEEEVNVEYLRNVILQFLEHQEMRPNLVRVLSVILHFTPQETRRLVAKV